MAIFKKTNWENAFENIIYFISGALVAAFITFKVLRATSNDVLDQIKPVIEKAIDKETIANDIVNKIEVETGKIKNSDSLQINIHHHPVNNQKPHNQIIKTDSCVIGISDYNKLSQNEKKRVQRWINK